MRSFSIEWSKTAETVVDLKLILATLDQEMRVMGPLEGKLHISLYEDQTTGEEHLEIDEE